MRTKLTLCLLALSLMGFVGCEKCKDCTTVTHVTSTDPTAHYNDVVTTSSDVCDDDLKSVDGKTTTQTTSSGTYTITVTAKTTCK